MEQDPTTPPNVVSIDGLKLLLSVGHRARLHCLETPVYTGSQLRGRWHVSVESPDGKDVHYLAGGRGEVRIREIKSVVPLYNLAQETGRKVISIPVEPGTSCLAFPESDPPGSAGE